MGIGLTFDEYAELRLACRNGAEPAFRQAAKIEREKLFPLSTAAASSHLRSRGYDYRAEMLDLLVKNGVVKLGESDV